MNRVPALSYFPGGQQLPNLNRNNKPGLPLPTDNVDLHQLKYDQIAKNADIANSNSTEEEKINAMITQSSQEYNRSNYLKRSNMTGSVPLSYQCHRCKTRGDHWISNCPFKKVKHSAGIPLSFMVPVDGPGHNGALLTKTGGYAVPQLVHQAYKEVKKEKPPFAPQDESVAEPKTQIPEELLCMICKDLLADAVATPCCANFFCDDCVRQALLESENHECPECHKTGVSPNELVPVLRLRTAVFKFSNTSRSTLDIISPPGHIENMEVLRLSHDSTVGNQPQQTKISSRQIIKPNTEEKSVSMKLEMPSTLELKVEVDSADINESSQPPVSVLDENSSFSQDMQPGTPLMDESSFDFEQPTLPVQAITHSSEPKPTSAIVTFNTQEFEDICYSPVHQQFPNERKDSPDFYSHNGDYYAMHQADRRSQWPEYYSPHSRYHYNDYHKNANNQYHGYDVEYDNYSHSGERKREPVCTQADGYRIHAHPVAVSPWVSVASLPVASPTLPVSQVYTLQSQPGPSGAFPVNTSHIAAEPPPPGVEPLLPPTVLIDPSAPFNKPPLNEVDERSHSRSQNSEKKRSRSSHSSSRSYAQSHPRTRTTESFHSHSRSRAAPRCRNKVESRERICSPRQKNQSQAKNFEHFPHRDITYVSGRHHTSRCEREQRPAHFDQDYEREFVGHRKSGCIGNSSHDYKRVAHVKESAEEPPSKRRRKENASKYKKHHHHHKS